MTAYHEQAVELATGAVRSARELVSEAQQRLARANAEQLAAQRNLGAALGSYTAAGNALRHALDSAAVASEPTSTT